MKHSLTLITLAAAMTLWLTGCSGSSADEPDNGTKGGLPQMSNVAVTRQQQLQNEFLEGKNGIPLSEGSTAKAFTYDENTLQSKLWSLFHSGNSDPGIIGGVRPPCIPVYTMIVEGCEPIIPRIGDYYEPENYNENPYPLIAEGGNILFPSILVKDGVISMKDYTLSDVYVQVDGVTVSHDTEADYGFIEEYDDSEFLKYINDGGSIKEISIKANKSDKPRTFWIKFYNPSSKYVYENGSNSIYIQIEQEAATE